MKIPLQLTFRDIPQSDAVETHVRRRAAKLETLFDSIVRCHVVVEAPHRHHQHGKRFHVRIDITVPRRELVVSRNPPENDKHEDMHATIDAAFDSAERVVEDYARRLHGQTKGDHLPKELRLARLQEQLAEAEGPASEANAVAK